MLLPQTSCHCQSHLPLRTRIVRAPVKAFHLSHCRGVSRLLPVICSKRTLQRIEWRWGNQDLQCRRRSDWGARQMRFVNAVLSTDPGMACSTSKAADSHAALLTNSFEQTFAVSSNGNHNVALVMGTTQNQTSLKTAQASAIGPSFGRFETEKQRQEVERLRRKKISEANKGRAPWNKGRKGEYKTPDEGSTSQLKVVEPISQEERENLRRQRISKANRGKVPWNKGGKHSLETKHRIREGVIERMKDPKIREKLRLQAEAVKLSPEVKLKIKMGIIKAWNEKRKIKAIQERCLIEWQETIAEMARIGCDGDVVYQWDSYSTIKETLRLSWQPPLKKQRKGVPRSDHSMEHRMRISAAIKAKWSDPNYRVSVQKGIKEFMMNREIPSRQIVTKPKPKACKLVVRDPVNSHTVRYPEASVRRDAAGCPKSSLKADVLEPVVLKPNIELPAYKDPETEKKLEKLMSMRVRRMSADAQKQKEITERARALILQAGEAAKALEAAAVKDKNALAPLLETRRLLAEAVSSLESMNRKKSNLESIKEGSSLYAHVLNLANATSVTKGKIENHLGRESKHLSESTSVGVEKSSLHTYLELNER